MNSKKYNKKSDKNVDDSDDALLADYKKKITNEIHDSNRTTSTADTTTILNNNSDSSVVYSPQTYQSSRYSSPNRILNNNACYNVLSPIQSISPNLNIPPFASRNYSPTEVDLDAAAARAFSISDYSFVDHLQNMSNARRERAGMLHDDTLEEPHETLPLDNQSHLSTTSTASRSLISKQTTSTNTGPANIIQPTISKSLQELYFPKVASSAPAQETTKANSDIHKGLLTSLSTSGRTPSGTSITPRNNNTSIAKDGATRDSLGQRSYSFTSTTPPYPASRGALKPSLALKSKFFEHQEYFDFHAVAEYFAKASSRSRKRSEFGDEKFNRPQWRTSYNDLTQDSLITEPRCIFFSEKTGSMYADTLKEFDFHGFLSPLIMTTEQINRADMESKSNVVEIEEILKSGTFWINICDPDLDEMTALAKLFGLHPLTTEDIQTCDTREKCDVFPHYYFISIRTFDQDQYSPRYLQTTLFYLVVFKDCILTFHSNPVTNVKNVLRRIDEVRAYGLQTSSDWINYAIIDDIADSFLPVLKLVEFEVDSIDDLVLILKESEQTDMLRRIGHARKKVLLLLRLLSSKPDLLKVIIKRCGDRMIGAAETYLYLGDIQDHVITMYQNIQHYEKTLARAHSNYLAQISIEITQSSNRTNDIAMKMTALASILIPLNVVTGLWGMNVKVPGQDIEDLTWFWSICAAMAIFAISTFLIVRKYYQLI